MSVRQFSWTKEVHKVLSLLTYLACGTAAGRDVQDELLSELFLFFWRRLWEVINDPMSLRCPRFVEVEV